MDEILLREYLKKKGIEGMNDKEFEGKFKEFMTERYNRGGGQMGGSSSRNHRGSYLDEEDLELLERMRRRRHNSPEEFEEIFLESGRGSKKEMEYMLDKLSRMSEEDKHKLMKSFSKSQNEESEHFTESYARFIVSEMYHTESGRKYVGEKYDMYKAKEICERYRGVIPSNVTHVDVYVAINAQYHDYCELFKTWFGDNIDQKIIEAAIVFWFKDVDYKGNKLWEYFNEE
jgi:hypothetical protein|nr:MAG TPA: hypothetical protein [Bacteriophage sp.]